MEFHSNLQDSVSSRKKLAYSNGECRIRNAESEYLGSGTSNFISLIPDSAVIHKKLAVSIAECGVRLPAIGRESGI